MTDELRELILVGASSLELRRKAVDEVRFRFDTAVCARSKKV